jgi:hypothetical protein
MNHFLQGTSITGLVLMLIGAGLLYLGKIDSETFILLLVGSGVLVGLPERTRKGRD